jgi:hypothetical protein
MPPRPNPIPYCLSARMLDYFSPSEVNPDWAHGEPAPHGEPVVSPRR